MKYSLSAKEAQGVLSGANQFKTKNISFKYLRSSSPALAFSIKGTMGSAVLRNEFKRKSRAVFLGPLFKNLSLHVLVRPIIKLNKKNNPLNDFYLLKKHLETNKNGSLSL